MLMYIKRKGIEIRMEVLQDNKVHLFPDWVLIS